MLRKNISSKVRVAARPAAAGAVAVGTSIINNIGISVLTWHCGDRILSLPQIFQKKNDEIYIDKISFVDICLFKILQIF